MNATRVWILRLAAVASLLIGAYLLYDAYQDFSWTRQATAEAGQSIYEPGPRQDRFLSESAEKERNGAASEHAGFLLVAAALIMDGLASVVRKLEARP
jgi:hypothetical protein